MRDNTKIQLRRRLVRNIALIVLGLGACAGVSFLAYMMVLAYIFTGLGDMFDSPVCDPATPSGIESVARIKLPPSAINLSSNCGGMQGWWAEAHFDMKPSDLTVFVNSTHVKLPLSDTDKPQELKCGGCNKLTGISSYLYGTYSAEEWFEEIFIDTSNPSLYRVYFTLLAG